jgi:hypothetical protein
MEADASIAFVWLGGVEFGHINSDVCRRLSVHPARSNVSFGFVTEYQSHNNRLDLDGQNSLHTI